jgi:hypothetical protein
VGKLSYMGECCLERCHRLFPDMVLECGSTEHRRLREGDRGGHGLKMGRIAMAGRGMGENREGWRKEIGEAMALKWVEAP